LVLVGRDGAMKPAARGRNDMADKWGTCAEESSQTITPQPGMRRPGCKGASRLLPRISHDAGAGVGGGVGSKFAVKLGEQRDAVGEAKLGAR
jgi:hypothetical protein